MKRMAKSSKFENSFSYKLIYIFRINDSVHKGLLKIGDATIKTDESIDQLPPNCKALNKAAKIQNSLPSQVRLSISWVIMIIMSIPGII